MLHDDRELFCQLVLMTAEWKRIDPGIVEKDYYVTLFLKKFYNLQPDMVFKGGTSLSKCHKLIERFSEDIDVTVNSDGRVTEGQRKKMKENVITVLDDIGLRLMNPDDIKSRRDFNRYEAKLPSAFKSDAIKRSLIVETTAHIRAYPNEIKQASAMVYDFLAESNRNDIISEFGLEPFDVRVQSVERTFVDKVFAICDYYLTGKIREHSRHIYDLYKILGVMPLNDALRALVNETRDERRKHKACLSAQDGVDINVLLEKIITEETYREDYENITSSLLFEKIGYNEAIIALKYVLDSKIF